MTGASEFYAGYLRVPPGQRRWLRLVVPTLLWGLCCVAALVGLTFPNAGAGTWDTSETLVVEGVLTLEPYPVLRDDQGGAAVLLVEVGKTPLREGIDGLHGVHVRAEGFALERDGLRMLELLPGEDGLRATGNRDRVTQSIADESLGRQTLRGEIVDSKCYAGAMKPGTGLTHRACATLCILQGIPPILLVETESGPLRLVLTDEAGEQAGPMVLDHVARDVVVEGERITRSGVEYLRIGDSSIRAP